VRVPGKILPPKGLKSLTIQISHRAHSAAEAQPNEPIYDMHGNVWQRVQDWYGEYASNSVVDPKGPDKGK
jgi:formylglycine-generating enzyme required for sulfatase activity